MYKEKITHEKDKVRLTKFANEINIRDLNKVTKKHIENYIHKRIKKDKLKPRTVKHHISIIRTFYNWYISRKYINTNPAKEVKTFKVEKIPLNF